MAAAHPERNAMPEKQEAKSKPRTIRTIADLKATPDKENPRVRTPRNRKVIEHSLRALGAGRSILADENGQIIAGNGTAEAAAKVGITKVRVVPTDGKELIVVQRSNLTEKQKKEMAIADNASALYSEWSEDIEAMSEGVDLEPYFTAAELDRIAGKATDDFQKKEQELVEGFAIIIEGINEEQQLKLLERLSAEGLSCRALTF
jgi:ParB-like chromosome segregation protein Spo0J